MASDLHRPARVLIVEDDELLHDLIVKVVGRAGFETVSAYNGEQALLMLQKKLAGIEWLVTDIRLPGVINGWVVGSEFALTHPLRPVIYMSGIEQDAAQRRAAHSIFLQKPVEITDLVATLTRLDAQQKDSAEKYATEPLARPDIRRDGESL